MTYWQGYFWEGESSNQPLTRTSGNSLMDEIMHVLYGLYPETQDIPVYSTYAERPERCVIAIKTGNRTLEGGTFRQEEAIIVTFVTQSEDSRECEAMMNDIQMALEADEVCDISSTGEQSIEEEDIGDDMFFQCRQT